MSAGKYLTFFVLFLLALAAHGSDHGHGKPLASPEAGEHDAAADISPARELPVMGEAPEFTLVSQDGKAFSSASLKGKVALYNFIYTECDTVCPVTSNEFARIQKMLKEKGLFGEQVVLISISIDPHRDTPEVLKEYSGQFGADHSGWHWLTGAKEDIERVVQLGFWVQYKKTQLRVQKSIDNEDHGDHGDVSAGYDFDHPPLASLVDGDGSLRAVYQMGTDPEEVVKDMQSLIGSGH